MNRDTFFTDLCNNMSSEEREAYHRSVVMNMDTPQAAEARIAYYKMKLRHMGKNVKIGVGVRIIKPENVSLGDNVQIGDNCHLIAGTEKGITLDDGARLRYGVFLDTETPKGYIEIGKEVYIGTGCCLHGHIGLEIGNFSLLAQNITITPSSHRFDDPDATIYSQKGFMKKLTIGRDCYIGMNVSIVYTGSIGDGSVIGAGSVVVKKIPPYSVALGVPAKVIKKREK